MSWSIFEVEAPDLAAKVKARFEAHPHHVIATIRASGAPRISGTNVEFRDGDLWLGSMPDSRKGADLKRDPRFALHSAPRDEAMAGGDAKIAGVAEFAGPTKGGPVGDSFKLQIAEASLVEVKGNHLIVTIWKAGGAVQVRKRK